MKNRVIQKNQVYNLKKDEQRTQNEPKILQNNQQDNIIPDKHTRKNRMWLWVLVWIVIFPIPLTILLLRNRNIDKKLKYVIIAVSWIIYLIIVFAWKGAKDITPTSSPPKENNDVMSVTQETTVENDATIASENISDDNTSFLTESEPQQKSSDTEGNIISESLTQVDAIDALVENFNAVSDNQLVFSEEFVVSNKDSGHYRTEFRLNAYKNAVGKSYKYNDKTVDIVATEKFLDKIDIRVYSYGITLGQCIELIQYISPQLDTAISDETITETINYVTEHKEANRYYGELGLTLFGSDKKGYELMIKTD